MESTQSVAFQFIIGNDELGSEQTVESWKEDHGMEPLGVSLPDLFLNL
jgi:hypothetical protein